MDAKKQETILAGLKQSRGQVGILEESLMRVQLELERVSFSLQAKTSAPRQPPQSTYSCPARLWYLCIVVALQIKPQGMTPQHSCLLFLARCLQEAQELELNICATSTVPCLLLSCYVSSITCLSSITARGG